MRGYNSVSICASALSDRAVYGEIKFLSDLSFVANADTRCYSG